jgi:hypothetical protein
MEVSRQVQAPVGSSQDLEPVVKHNNLLSLPGIEPRILTVHPEA